MKGLLLKDLYMTMKYCRSYLLIMAVFIAVSFAEGDNLFFLFYPCLLCGMIPVSLLGYDERSHWTQYSGTLPYSKGELVSCKYLIGLMAQVSMLVVVGAARGIRDNMNGTFAAGEFIALMLMVLISSTITSSISLPFIFKLGVEKGRIAYMVTIGIVCAASIALMNIPAADRLSDMDIKLDGILARVCVTGALIYALSWYLSIKFYTKREV